MSGLFEDLSARGLFYQLTHPEELKEKLNTPGQTIYIGFDPTAESLHIGSLVPLLMLARFQRAGHHPIALVGGGTGFIGDPGGKSEERNLLSPEKLEANLRGIRPQIERFVDLSPGRGTLLNNADWLCSFSLISFLRDVGKRFSVNMMLEKDSVRTRIESRDQGISYTEFSYMLLQAYDFLHLYDHHRCTLQAGGSDQWGNITLGTDLIRRARAGEAFGFTWPLLTKSDGGKFGKSEKGNVWLDPKLTSPYQFYQFFLRTEDADVMRFLRLLTFVPHDELAVLEEAVRTRPEAREAQKRLARELTDLVHGPDETRRVEQAAQALFGGSLLELDELTLLDVFAEAPSSTLDLQRIGTGVGVVDILVESTLSASKGMARKDVAGGGVYLNNERVSDRALDLGDLLFGKYLIVRKGKKNYHLIRVQ